MVTVKCMQVIFQGGGFIIDIAEVDDGFKLHNVKISQFHGNHDVQAVKRTIKPKAESQHFEQNTGKKDCLKFIMFSLNWSHLSRNYMYNSEKITKQFLSKFCRF